MSIKVGDRVRITEAYKEIGEPDEVGIEFDVTAFIESPWTTLDGEEFYGYAQGDPMRRGIWDNYLEVVEIRGGRS